jgi:rhamnosyltransferase subunit B
VNPVAHLLFTTFGSYGDLYPYIALAIESKDLGHRVTIATSETYRAKVESEGIGFAAIRPDMSLENREMMQYLFDQRRGTERVIRAVADVVRDSYEDTVQASADVDAIITHPMTFGAVLVAQKLRLPWISSVLAPISFLSAYEPPIPAPLPSIVKLRRFGPGVMRAVWNAGKRHSMSWTRPVTKLRRELGLPPAKDPLFEDAQSPELVLALFSPSFAEPQPDWPAQAVITGFPFYDGPDVRMPAELEAFLEAGDPPIVFTLGSSAVGAAGDFYADSLRAAESLNARAVFLTGPHPQNLPQALPSSVIAWPYAPHALIFKRAAAIVHQGGIGTTAQALRSGRPLLTVPFAHDQYDNAERIRRLGVGLTVSRSKYKARSAATALRTLLQEASYPEAAAAAAARIRSENGAATAARAIHDFVRRRSIE